MLIKLGFRFWLNLIVLAALGLSPAATAFTPQQAAASPLEQALQAAGVKAPKSGPAAEVGKVIGGPRVRDGMDVAPAADKAVVTDRRIPAWENRYNTMAGVTFMEPLAPPPGLAALGPLVDVGGFRSFNLGGADAIRGIAASYDGRIFAGIDGVGLGVYSRQSSGVYAWSIVTTSPGGLGSADITDLAVSGDMLWVATSGSGIYVYYLSVGGWGHFTTSNTDLPSNSINSLTGIPSVAGNEEFYASTESGAWYYYQDPFGLSTGVVFAGTPVNKAIQQILPTGTRVEWFANDLQLWRYDGAWTSFQGMAGCPLDSASDLAVDGQNGVWVAAYTNGPAAPEGAVVDPDAPAARFPIGVCRYAGGVWTQYTTATPGLPSNKASDLETDKDGRVWMTFEYYNSALGGAAVYDQGTWLVFKKQYGDPLLTDDLSSVGVAGESVWFGYTNLASVTQYSNNWARFTTLHTGGSGAAGSVFVDQSETYIGRASGISYNDGVNWIYRPIFGLSTAISQMVRLNNLWIGTRGNGIFEYDGTSFIPHTTAEGLASDDVRGLVVDRQFRLWAATGDGLSLRTNGYWLNFNSANSPLTSNDLTAITAGSDGRIWIGTNGAGVWALDPNIEAGMEGAPPNPVWTQVTTAEGLASDTIWALVVEPNGAVWAGGPGGQARRDPVSGAWAKTGAIDTTSLSVDPSGRVWLGTSQGLWSFDGTSRQFLTGFTLLDSDSIQAIGSDGRRTWVVSGGNVQVRADITGPIGFFPPSISSFSPGAGGVDQMVTVNGANFDARNTFYNTVSFGNLSDSYTYGVVTSASANQMSVKVPLMALTGQIWVRAHRLNGVSAASFTVLPAIRSITPACASLGGELVIEGSGFNSSGLAAYVRMGGGPWRYSDSQNPTTLRYRIRPGDMDGPASVRLGPAGAIITSAQSLTIDTPVIDQVGIQQAVQGLPLVWAKRTLIMLSMRSSRGLCPSRVDGGQLEFKLKDGSTRLDWLSYQPTAAGLTVGTTAPALGVSSGVNFVMWSQALSQPDFAIGDFDGVRVHLFNGPVEVVTYDIPNGSFYFTDMAGRRQHMNAYVYNTAKTTNADWEAFYKNAEKGLAHVARVYPESDIGAYFGKDKWMTWAWRTIGRTAMINLGSDDTFHDLQEQVEDIRSSANDNGGSYDQAMGVIDASLMVGSVAGKATYNCSNPFSDCDQHSAVAFNTTDSLAPTWLQEGIHTMNWIQDSSPNHDGGNKTHSRYNNVDSSGNCAPAITYRQALVDQLGYAARVVRLEYGKAPYQFLFANCSAGSMPTSAMSYAPGSADNNTFLEPLDFFYVFNNIRIFGQAAAAGSVPDGRETILGGLFGWPTAPQSHQELRLNGQISSDETHTVTISMAYLDDPGGDLTGSSPSGPFQLIFRDGGGASLEEFPFSVGTGHTHGATEKDFGFSLRVAFPDGTQSVAIRHEGADIWNAQVSASAPVVSLTSPVQYQSYNAIDPLPVAWDASDPDGDPLSFILEYSPDDGLTWQTIATGLSGAGYDWTPGFAPVGLGRLRITASDGFNTALATSEQFYIQPDNPVAIIQSPLDGQVIYEGGEIVLAGEAIASASEGDVVQYDWYYDGVYAASGQYLYESTSEVGTHTIGLQVIANGLPSEMVTISFTVVPDYDQDGLPNDFEQANGINPMDRSDSAADPDGDGLSTLLELQTGTSPIVADSDGDTINDGDELAMGGDPTDPGSVPSVSPVLHVGANKFGFIYRQGDPAPDPWSIWVTNGAGGTLDWSAESSAPWLLIGSAAGSAPGELVVSADPSGLAPGLHTASLTVSAAGAGGSPVSIPVWIRVYDANGDISYSVFLPVMRR